MNTINFNMSARLQPIVNLMMGGKWKHRCFVIPDNLDKHINVQVECYPRASLKGKYQPDNIVLNIGINSKDDSPSSALNHLRLMMSSIRKTVLISKLHFVEFKFCNNQINCAAKSLRDVKFIQTIPKKDF